MAVERTLIAVCLLTGGVLLVLIVAPKANAMKTGSDVRQRTSGNDYADQVTSGTGNMTNGSVSGTPGRQPTYLNSGNGSGMECVELRSKRYISDGHCTSVRPLMEAICSGRCLPVRTLPWYPEFVRAWTRTSPVEWRCVDDVVRKRKVTLLCEDGTTRSHKVRVVKSCRCKHVVRRRHTDLAVSEAGNGGGGRGGGGGRRAPSSWNGRDLERPRDSNEKRRKSRRKERRSRHEDVSS